MLVGTFNYCLDTNHLRLQYLDKHFRLKSPKVAIIYLALPVYLNQFWRSFSLAQVYDPKVALSNDRSDRVPCVPNYILVV